MINEGVLVGAQFTIIDYAEWFEVAWLWVRRGTGEVVENSKRGYFGLATVVVEPFCHHLVVGDDVVGMVEPADLALMREVLVGEGLEVVDNGDNFGSAHVGQATNEFEVFIERILNNYDIFWVKSPRGFEYGEESVEISLYGV